jgi:hypothetical protein
MSRARKQASTRGDRLLEEDAKSLRAIGIDVTDDEYRSISVSDTVTNRRAAERFAARSKRSAKA